MKRERTPEQKKQARERRAARNAKLKKGLTGRSWPIDDREVWPMSRDTEGNTVGNASPEERAEIEAAFGPIENTEVDTSKG